MMTTDGDLLLEEHHEAGIWLPEELEEQASEALRQATCQAYLGPIDPSNRYLKALYPLGPAWNRQPVRQGPCEAPWNRHPPSRQCSCSWSSSWRGLRQAVVRQLQCPPTLYWALILAILFFILA